MTTALRYSLRRVFLLLITMLLVSLLTYLAFELVSGDPARTMLGTEATEDQVQALRHEMGQAMTLRYTPELVFEIDHSIEYGAHINEVIQSLDIKHDEDEGSGE